MSDQRAMRTQIGVPVSIETAALVIGAGAAPISQAIRPGEIVGLAGLDGHGQERFLETLAGLRTPVSGEVALERSGNRTQITGFRKAVANGVAYLPRDRRATGIFPTQSVLDNFAISTVGRDAAFGLISPQSRRRRYEIYRDKLSISAPRPDAAITTLSGGNQQKVLLARALALEPGVLLLNDPTRGVDVATRHVLYDVFRDLAREGMTLVILSSEIEEILLLCCRVLVFRENEVTAEMAGANMTTDSVIAAMFGRSA
jgi:ribose transport system ATP-binding protein